MSADVPQSPYNFERRPSPPPNRRRRWLAPSLVAVGTLIVGLVIGNAAGGGSTPSGTAADAGSTVTVTSQPKALAAVTVTRQAKAAAAKTTTVRSVQRQTVRVPTTVAVTKAVTHEVTRTVQHDRTVQQLVKVTVTAAAAQPQQVADAPEQHQGGTWLPSGGSCPEEAPIKGNASSMIYHLPGGQYYDRTNPEACFATEADAVAAGYRASQR